MVPIHAPCSGFAPIWSGFGRTVLQTSSFDCLFQFHRHRTRCTARRKKTGWGRRRCETERRGRVRPQHWASRRRAGRCSRAPARTTLAAGRRPQPMTNRLFTLVRCCCGWSGRSVERVDGSGFGAGRSRMAPVSPRRVSSYDASACGIARNARNCVSR